MNSRLIRFCVALGLAVLSACGGGTSGVPGEGAGGSGGTPAQPQYPAPIDVTASDSHPDRVELSWRMPTDAVQPSGFEVLREGLKIVELPAGANGFTDVEAAPGKVSLARFEADAAPDAIALSWSAAEPRPGRPHSYRIRAVFGADSAAAATSESVSGARAAPVVLGYRITRDDTEVAQLGADATTWIDTDALAGGTTPPRDLGATSSPEAVHLNWALALAEAGPSHEYRIEALLEANDERPSRSATAARPGPQPTRYVIERDGERIAEVGATADSFVDEGAAPGSSVPPTDLVASIGTDAAAVHLGWTAPAPTAGTPHRYQVFADFGSTRLGSNEVEAGRTAPALEGYTVERDGRPVATLPADVRAWSDVEAEGGGWTPPVAVVAEPGVNAVRLAWSAPAPIPGMRHAYRVVAEFSGDVTAASEVAEGHRAPPSMVGFRVQRDGVTITDLDATAVDFLDDGAGAGALAAPLMTATGTPNEIELAWQPASPSPGPSHAWVIATIHDHGVAPAAPVEAARFGPDPAGWVVQRDGADLATVDAATLTFSDSGTEPGALSPPTGLTASQGTSIAGVDLSWTAPVGTPGTPHSYVVLPIAGTLRGPASVPVQAARAAPDVDSYLVYRDGEEVAVVAGDDLGWLDQGAASVGAPPSLTASRGAYEDAVALNWTSAGAPPAHDYTVRATGGGLTTSHSSEVSGFRAAAAVVGYEFSRDDGHTWHPTETDQGHFDFDAPAARITATVVADLPEYTGKVILERKSVYVGSFVTATYLVRALTADGHGPPSPAATGWRRVGTDPLVTTWQESTGDADADYVDLPEGMAVLPPGEARYYRAVLTRGGAHGVTGAVRVENKAFAKVAAAPLDGVGGFWAAPGCGLHVDGTVRCWGAWRMGEWQQPVPAREVPGQFVDIAGVYNGICLLDALGIATCVGGTVRSPDPAGVFTKVVGDDRFTCGIRATDDRIVCFGSGTEVTSVAIAPPGYWQDLDVSERFACAIDLAGALHCWGDDAGGRTAPPSGTFTQVAVGRHHACALHADGTAACWGRNNAGQSNPPTGTFTEVAVADTISCGLRHDGTVECWGSHREFTGTFVDLDGGQTQYICGVQTDGAIVCH